MKIGKEFTLSDFKTMEDIEHSYFSDDNIIKAEDVLKQYEKNNLTCIGVRNYMDKIIANVNILPLKEEVFYDIYENKMNEADASTIHGEKICKKLSKMYYITNTSHNSKSFCKDEDEFLNIVYILK